MCECKFYVSLACTLKSVVYYVTITKHDILTYNVKEYFCISLNFVFILGYLNCFNAWYVWKLPNTAGSRNEKRLN